MADPLYTVVIADDHPVRSGIRADLKPPLQVVGEAGDATAALRLIDAHQPDLVVCDLNMPDGGGLRVVRETAARHGDRVRVVMFTVSEQERDLIDAVACGAFGYLTKSTPAEELQRQLVRAAHGDPPVAPQLATLLLGEFRASGSHRDRIEPAIGTRARSAATRRPWLHLPPSRHRVVHRRKTVENHVRNILGELHLCRRAKLIRWAADHGIR